MIVDRRHLQQLLTHLYDAVAEKVQQMRRVFTELLVDGDRAGRHWPHLHPRDRVLRGVVDQVLLAHVNRSLHEEPVALRGLHRAADHLIFVLGLDAGGREKGGQLQGPVEQPQRRASPAPTAGQALHVARDIDGEKFLLGA